MSNEETPHTRPETDLIHGDRMKDDFSVTPPLEYSATFKAHSKEMFTEIASKRRHPRFYTRYGNPLHERIVKIIASLEGAESGLVASSGMGAISTAIFALVQAGDHIVLQRNHYMGTYKLVTQMLPRFGVEFTAVDQVDSGEFERAIRPNTKLILTETPANPIFTLTDLEAVARIGKKRGIPTLCDNTFATPINQNPIRLGIDIVVHSATKFLGGHHDLTAGVIVSRNELLDRIWQTMITLGPTLSPMDAWLLLRGLRTLAIRVERQNETAMHLARFLAAHPAVERVYYPGLESHPQYGLAKSQMKGFGGILAFSFKGTFDETAELVGRLRIPTNAASLGGVETLAVHIASMWAGSMSVEQMQAANIPVNLVRLSVGLEHRLDLISDLKNALG